MRQLLAETRHVGRMIQVLRVALFGDRERCFGQPRFDGQHGRGIFARLRVRLAGQRENLAHMLDILLALLCRLGIRARVVVALRQSQAAAP